MNKTNVYSIITERILQELEKGVIPWKKPWKTSRPKNFVSGKEYRGMNLLLLGMQNYNCSYWATFNQIKSKGGQVKKGERSTPVIFWKYLEKNEINEDQEEKRTSIPLLRYYKVWNLEQTTLSLPKEEALENFNNIEEAEKIMSGYKNCPPIEHKGHRALYSPKEDKIIMPNKKIFNSEEDYYLTLFHEAVHSTGHTNRLARPEVCGNANFGSEVYSREELVAEAGASFLCGLAGIEMQIKNSAAYIQNWTRRLKDDNRILVLAFGRAQRAVDYITETKIQK